MRALPFRHDINSLRFFAVILVFFSHISISGFSNGFIGVDIFFVISGFFITGLINKKLNKKKVLNFLVKRIKRLFPNLILISLIIFFCSYIFLPKYILENIYINFFSSIFGFANFNFLVQSKDYFAPSGDTNPFLHIWSLSVEKHFYIIFLLIFICFSFKITKKYKVIFIILLTVSSLLLSIDLSGIKHFYFLTFLRIFEFGIGSLSYMIKFKLSDSNQNFLSSLALAILIFSLIFIDPSKGIPGWQILFPCIGTAMILISPRSSFNKFISTKLFSYLGKTSYLIYLIHWPLIVLLSFYFHLSIFLKVIIFVTTLVFSSLLYSYYETKVRYNNIFFNYFLIISSLLIFFISISFYIEITFKKNNFFQEKFLADRKLRFQVKKLPQDNTKNNQILFVGDSFADDLYRGLGKNNHYLNGMEVQRVHVDTICYNQKHQRTLLGRLKNELGSCEKQLILLKNSIKQHEPKIIFVANHWQEHNYKYLSDLMKIMNLNIKNNTKLVVIGMRDTFKDYDQIFSRNTEINSINHDFLKNRKNIENINNFFKKFLDQDNVIYYKPYSVCNQDISKCELVDSKTKSINYVDYTHYSVEFSKKVINKLKEDLNEKIFIIRK
ncbi:acyltransferase [Candidatus Pelagibacter sp.]|nr:acyltransferase [Candidatus Pelagibacter sp.]